MKGKNWTDYKAVDNSISVIVIKKEHTINNVLTYQP